MPIRIGKSMKIHDTLYMLRKCMDGGDEDVFLFAGIILFIIFLKHFQKVFDECYREKSRFRNGIFLFQMLSW